MRFGHMVPSAGRVLLTIVLLGIIPARIVVDGYRSGSGFLRWVCFGSRFQSRRLPEVTAMAPPVESTMGYDGQFYAQLAVRPDVRDPAVRRALDTPAYRARRILLPALAHAAGTGHPVASLHAYTLLNPAAWAALLCMLIVRIGLRGWRDVLLAASLLLGTGTLVSVERALTDFPAAVLLSAALLLPVGGGGCVGLLACAVLAKDLSLLAVPMFWRNGVTRGGLWRCLGMTLAAAAPFLLWIGWLRWGVGLEFSAGRGNFNLPAYALIAKLRTVLDGPVHPGASGWLHWVFEFLCPLSLLVQAVYFAVRPAPVQAAWRMGVGFAALLFVLGPSVWVEQQAYARVMLPLTVAFNILLHGRERGAAYRAWFLAGNVGLARSALLAL